DEDYLQTIACIAFGLPSLGVLGWRAWVTSGPARTRVLSFFLPACLMPGLTGLTGFFLFLSVDRNPTYDALLYKADGALGAQLSFLAGQLFAAAPILAAFCSFIYFTLPIPFGIVLALELRSRRLPPVDFLSVY